MLSGTGAATYNAAATCIAAARVAGTAAAGVAGTAAAVAAGIVGVVAAGTAAAVAGTAVAVAAGQAAQSTRGCLWGAAHASCDEGPLWPGGCWSGGWNACGVAHRRKGGCHCPAHVSFWQVAVAAAASAWEGAGCYSPELQTGETHTPSLLHLHLHTHAGTQGLRNEDLRVGLRTHYGLRLALGALWQNAIGVVLG